MPFPFLFSSSYLLSMQQTTIADTTIRRDYTVLASDLNGYGFMHGGRLLMLADKIGFLAAHGFCNTDCLTVATHQTRFHHPAYEGDNLILQAQVAFTGKTSLWVSISILDADAQLLMESIMVYAAVDDKRIPTRVPDVVASNAAEHQLQAEVIRLREFIQSNRVGGIAE